MSLLNDFSKRDEIAFYLKANSDDVSIGGFYTIGGVECTVLEVLNDEECVIVDLFEQKERRANKRRLEPIDDASQLQSAKSSYREYLNAKQTESAVDHEANHVTEFTLTTDMDKNPDDNKNEHHTITCNYVPCECCIVVAAGAAIFFGVIVCVMGHYLIGSLIIGVCLIVLCVGYYLFGGGCKHKNKISFDANKQMIYLHWNDKVHRRIPFNQFSRLGWHRYVWHGRRSDDWFAMVYVVRKHQKPIRFNWYLVDRLAADQFTKRVNQYWAEMQGIAQIHNEMPDEYTNFMKDNVRRHDQHVIVSGHKLKYIQSTGAELA